MYKLIILALFTILSSYSFATNWHSGPDKVNLIELYTSEGCSSCPPADKWLSSLSSHPELWQRFIPIALHVDYWDYIGWKDPFADPKHSRRQRKLAKTNNNQNVYTPGFFLNGKEWQPTNHKLLTNERTGRLTLSSNKQETILTFLPEYIGETGTSNPSIAHVALLGFALQSNVKKGENRGRQLDHDFVVLSHQLSNEVKINNATAHNVFTWTLPPVKFSENKKNIRYGIVAWIEEKEKFTPIQAVGGWLNNDTQ